MVLLGMYRSAMAVADRFVSWASPEVERQAEIDCCYERLQRAESYEEWVAVARHLDEIEGRLEWKHEPSSLLYDAKRIQQQCAEMTRLKAEGDFVAMSYWLRSSMQRNLGGMGNPKLHNHCHVGTKALIENYHEEMLRMLRNVCHCRDQDIALDDKLNFFAESRHALGKTALLLSGGASLGMYHFGVMKALHLQGLLPRVISGSSAGAIVLAILGTKTDDELHALFTTGPEHFQDQIRLDFFSANGSLHRKLKRVLTQGVVMDIVKLQEAVRFNIGDVTFAEAYSRTGRIINITVSPGNAFERPLLLNYLTAPNVLVWSAASASCALPGLYESVQLKAKDQRGDVVLYHMSDVKWTDGSLEQDLPIHRLKELFNVNYLIVSQTNPHAIPFVTDDGERSSQQRAGQPGLLRRAICRAAGALSYLVCSEIMLRCHQLVGLGLAPGVLSLLLSQQYIGDVTIVPPLTLEGYAHIISNPTMASLQRFVQVAQQRTWPIIEQIRLNCQVEMVLDECVRVLAHRKQERVSHAAFWRSPALAMSKQKTQKRPTADQTASTRHGEAPRDGGADTCSAAGEGSGAGDAAATAASPNHDGPASPCPSPHLLGRPRLTHLDLCHFFSVGSVRGGEIAQPRQRGAGGAGTAESGFCSQLSATDARQGCPAPAAADTSSQPGRARAERESWGKRERGCSLAACERSYATHSCHQLCAHKVLPLLMAKSQSCPGLAGPPMAHVDVARRLDLAF